MKSLESLFIIKLYMEKFDGSKSFSHRILCVEIIHQLLTSRITSRWFSLFTLQNTRAVCSTNCELSKLVRLGHTQTARPYARKENHETSSNTRTLFFQVEFLHAITGEGLMSVFIQSIGNKAFSWLWNYECLRHFLSCFCNTV